MRIELLYFDGCPSYAELLPRLRELIASEGIDEDVELHRVETPEEAEREVFLGSPTVRIDGEDVDPMAKDRDEFGLECRPIERRRVWPRRLQTTGFARRSSAILDPCLADVDTERPVHRASVPPGSAAARELLLRGDLDAVADLFAFRSSAKVVRDDR